MLGTMAVYAIKIAGNRARRLADARTGAKQPSDLSQVLACVGGTILA
jgi:hypothetical protein